MYLTDEQSCLKQPLFDAASHVLLVTLLCFDSW